MTVSVPQADQANYTLQQDIATLTTQITAAGSNGPLVAELTQAKTQKQVILCCSLIGSGRVVAASVLSNETYVAGQNLG